MLKGNGRNFFFFFQKIQEYQHSVSKNEKVVTAKENVLESIADGFLIFIAFIYNDGRLN